MFIFKQQPQKSHKQDILPHKILKSVDCSLHPTGRMPWIILHVWGLLCIRDAGCRANKIIKT